MAAYVTQTDVENRFTPRQVRRLFTDDGSATMNTAAFNEAVEEASDIADQILAKAWKDPTARAEIAAGKAAKGAICRLVIAIGAERKPEWQRQDGKSPYDGFRSSAEKMLERIAGGELRPAAESTAGANPTLAGDATVADPQFIFAPTDGEDPGGY